MIASVARPVVCIVGAGTAGLEALLSIREALGASVDLWLVAPDREFRYRPMHRDSLFRPARERGIKVADLVAETGATWVRDRAEVVRESERCLLTRDGDIVAFDYLLIAAGERSKRPLAQGYLWERGGDPSFLDAIIRQIAARTVASVAVAVPRGARWSLPAYEIALVLAWSAAGTDASVTLITAEERPLGALGTAASDAVSDELELAGVETITGVELADAPARGTRPMTVADLIIVPERAEDEASALIGAPTDPARVQIGAGVAREFERLISLPVMLGPRVAGVARDHAGFVAVDESLKVCGSDVVWAAGGCIAAALEHSALSARQADAAVRAITAACGHTGAGSGVGPDAIEISGVLLSGQRDQWLAENPIGTPEPSTRCLWWPPGRAVGKTLARRIAAWDPSVHERLPTHSSGLAIRAPVALGCDGALAAHTSTAINEAVQRARLHDLERRQLMAVRRLEREADAEVRALNADLQTFAADERHVIHTLREHGYLRER
jgi:sulfide:quinone oxidoreductase